MTDGPAGPAHTEHEDVPWTIQIPDHPARTDTPEYVASRATMNRLAAPTGSEPYGPPPYQDHHGGGLWLKDEAGWFLVRNVAGIEWSAQFCADPAKVDGLRLVAQRMYARFPEAVDELGIRSLLDTPITDADGVSRWTDSICNASVPLPPARHVGMLPGAPTGGVHHYPTPIADIDLIRRDDFQLWVETPGQGIVAVVPMAPAGSGDGRTRILLAATRPPSTAVEPLAAIIGTGSDRAAGPAATGLSPEAIAGGRARPLEVPPPGDAAGAGPGRPGGDAAAGATDRTILPANHPVSLKAFEHQR